MSLYFALKKEMMNDERVERRLAACQMSFVLTIGGFHNEATISGGNVSQERKAS